MVDPAGSSVVGRRRLAVALRRHRLAAGRTIDDVARHLECSAAKVSRIETGGVKVGPQDLRAILDLYEVSDGEREEMLGLVRQARTRGWWTEFTDVVPTGSATFYGLEDGATSIRQHTTSLVPGLLQTEDYARALIGSVPGIEPELAERRVALRTRRQLILDRAQPPRLDVVLDEAVLHRTIGGPEVLAAQLDHLVALNERPSVSVRVVEFSAGAHPAVGISFTIFGFGAPTPTRTRTRGRSRTDEADSPVVFREQLDSNHYLDDPADIDIYARAWTAAADVALEAAGSARLLQSRAQDVRRLADAPVPR